MRTHNNYRHLCIRQSLPTNVGLQFRSRSRGHPSRYLLATRLNRVRRDILDQGVVVSLQVLATRWGLTHMSRFARYYRETFGERPSDTMRTAALRDRPRGAYLTRAPESHRLTLGAALTSHSI